MLVRRDPIAIGSVGNYTQNQSQSTSTVKSKLETDIKAISDSYKGVDADTIISSLLNDVAKLESVISNFDYFGNYMKAIADADKENLNSTNKNFSTINDKKK